MQLRSMPKNTLLAICASFAISCIAQADPVTEFEQKLITYQGKVVYVDFWASWCGPCRQSFPWMNKMQASYQSQGFEIISINLDSNSELAEKFLLKFPASFDVIYDPEGVLAKKYQIKGMPSSFILNRKSRVSSAHVGFTEQKSQKYKKEIIGLIQLPE